MMVKEIFGLVILSVFLFCGSVLAFTALDKDSFPDENLLPFRMGNAPSLYDNDYWDDGKATILSSKAAIDGQRKKLPEQHFVNWGYGIEVDDCKTANRVGVYDIVGYLCTPSKEHSKAPSNAENNPPLNLYEPIFVNGAVNENNYWAYYVNRTVSTYKDYVRIWEVYNEPDYTEWYIPPKWETEPPVSSQLPHWRGNVFEYNRIMRITYEVVKSVDPTAWVAPGGLGYTSFLDAMLRYTDNPDDGSVTEDYPLKGGAYFDCLAFHQYPMYGQTDEKTGIGYHGKGSDNLAMKFVTLKKNMEYRLEKYGFDGETYPRKMFICTETGISDVVYDGIGGDLVRRNYVLKQMLYAREYGIKQSHWFGVADFGGDNAYGHMGDFYSATSQTLDTVTMKDSSRGRLVWRDLQLAKMDFDSDKTVSARKMLASLNIVDGNFTASVFKSNGITSWTYSPNETLMEQPSEVYVFWRRSDFDDEINQSVKLPLKMGHPCRVIRYDGTYVNVSSKFEIDVDSTPVFIIPSNHHEDSSGSVHSRVSSVPNSFNSASFNSLSVIVVVAFFVAMLL